MTSSTNPSLPLPGPRLLCELVARLPELPPALRYYDEFDDQIRSVSEFKNISSLEFWSSGACHILDISGISAEYRTLLKHLAVQILGEDLQASTAYWTLSGFNRLSERELDNLLSAGPHRIAITWQELRAKQLPESAYGLVKRVLKLLCSANAFGWSTDYLDFIGSHLPMPASDAYAGVRSGDAFLSQEEEAVLVKHIDEAAATISRKGHLAFSFDSMCDTAMIVCCLQFGMRPIQVASVKRRDVKVFRSVPEAASTCHVTFPVAKQRGTRRTLRVVRRVKREWVCIFEALLHGEYQDFSADRERFFGVRSSRDASRRVSRLVSSLIGVSTSATDLRHTAAQRLVDAGASHEELAEFLCHSETTTGLVYFRTAASHAELVNRALGASAVYRQVAKIAHAGFITPELLALLNDDQQIGAAPHGMPIAGIGGCTSGQPACPNSPVLSCYGCPKFMPVRDVAIHEEALQATRGIVRFFVDSSRGEEKSPTYLQLRHTIGQMQAVIDELGGAAS